MLTDAELAFPTNLVTAYGRATGYTSGPGTGAGTIFLKKTGDVNGTLIARLDDPLDASDDGPVDEDEEDTVAGPIAIAVDINETDGAGSEPGTGQPG